MCWKGYTIRWCLNILFWNLKQIILVTNYMYINKIKMIWLDKKYIKIIFVSHSIWFMSDVLAGGFGGRRTRADRVHGMTRIPTLLPLAHMLQPSIHPLKVWPLCCEKGVNPLNTDVIHEQTSDVLWNINSLEQNICLILVF